MRALRQPQIAVKRTGGLGNIVYILGGSGNMLVTGFVAFLVVDGAADAIDGLHHIHGSTLST